MELSKFHIQESVSEFSQSVEISVTCALKMVHVVSHVRKQNTRGFEDASTTALEQQSPALVQFRTHESLWLDL